MKLEDLATQRRICVMLRADGWSYGEMAEISMSGIYTVRHELEQATGHVSGALYR